MYCYEIFSLFWCGEITPEYCPSILDTPYMHAVNMVLEFLKDIVGGVCRCHCV